MTNRYKYKNSFFSLPTKHVIRIRFVFQFSVNGFMTLLRVFSCLNRVIFIIKLNFSSKKKEAISSLVVEIYPSFTFFSSPLYRSKILHLDIIITILCFLVCGLFLMIYTFFFTSYSQGYVYIENQYSVLIFSR